MDHLIQYIAALNNVIKAGVDVRYILNGTSVPVIRAAVLLEAKMLQINYLVGDSPFDQTAIIPASAKFSVEFNDLPNELRDANWK